MSIGGTIHALRLEKRMRQNGVAQHLNVSVSTVSNYEMERHLPDIVTLSKIADLFDVSVDFIIGRSPFRHSFRGYYEDYKHSETHLARTEDFFVKLHSLPENQRELVYDRLHELANNNEEVDQAVDA